MAASRVESEVTILRQDKKWQPRYLHLLAPVLMMTMLVNQFLNVKTIDVFGMSMVASIITYPLSLIVCDILTEVYGYRRVRQLIWVCLIFYAANVAFVQMAVALPPAAEFKYNEGYVALFGQLPRIALGGVIGYLTGELINSWTLSKLKVKDAGRKGFFFYKRALVSTLLSQTVNCVLFMVIGFAGVLSWGAIINSAVISVVIILGYEALVLPLTHKLAETLKKMEGVDYFEG